MPKDDFDDSFDMEDDFDFDFDGGGGDEIDSSSTRTPAEKGKLVAKEAAKSVGPGVAQAVKKGVDRGLPEVGKAVDEGLNFASDSRKLFDDFSKEIESTVNTARIVGNRVVNKLDGYLPGKIAGPLKKAFEPREDSHLPSKDEVRDSAIASSLAETFGGNKEAEEAKEKKDDLNRVIDRGLGLEKYKNETQQRNKLIELSSQRTEFNKTVFTSYLKKSLELKYRHLYVSMDILKIAGDTSEGMLATLEQIRHNTALPDVVKKRNSEFFFETMRGSAYQGIGDQLRSLPKRFLGNVKSNVLDKLKSGFESAVDMADQLTGTMEMGEDIGMDKTSMALELGGGQAGSLAGGLLGSKLIQKLIKDKPELIQGLNTNAKYAKEKLAIRLNQFSDENSGEGGVKGFVSDLLPGVGVDSVRNTLVDNYDQEYGYDMASRTSVVTVIPTLLSKILKGVTDISTGEDSDEIMFDPETSSFVSVDSYRERAKSKMFLSSQSRVQTRIGKLNEKVQGDTQSDSITADLNKFIVQAGMNGRSLPNYDAIKAVGRGNVSIEDSESSWLIDSCKGLKNPKALVKYLYEYLFLSDGTIDYRAKGTFEDAVFTVFHEQGEFGSVFQNIVSSYGHAHLFQDIATTSETSHRMNRDAIQGYLTGDTSIEGEIDSKPSEDQSPQSGGGSTPPPLPVPPDSGGGDSPIDMDALGETLGRSLSTVVTTLGSSLQKKQESSSEYGKAQTDYLRSIFSELREMNSSLPIMLSEAGVEYGDAYTEVTHEKLDTIIGGNFLQSSFGEALKSVNLNFDTSSLEKKLDSLKGGLDLSSLNESLQTLNVSLESLPTNLQEAFLSRVGDAKEKTQGLLSRAAHGTLTGMGSIGNLYLDMLRGVGGMVPGALSGIGKAGAGMIGGISQMIPTMASGAKSVLNTSLGLTRDAVGTGLSWFRRSPKGGRGGEPVEAYDADGNPMPQDQLQGSGDEDRESLIMRGLKAGGKGVKKGYEFGKDLLGFNMDMVTKGLGSLFSGGSKILEAIFGKKLSKKHLQEVVGDRLDTIITRLDTIVLEMQGDSISGDTDGDGFREGGWRERIYGDEETEKEKKQRVLRERAQSIWAKNGGVVPGAPGMFSTVGGGIKSIRDRFKKKPTDDGDDGDDGGIIDTAVGSLAGTVGAGVLSSTGIGASVAGAASSAGAAIGGAASSLGAGAVALASNPVGWGIAAALAVGAIGYGVYKWMQPDGGQAYDDFTLARMKVYGAPSEYEDIILTLEEDTYDILEGEREPLSESDFLDVCEIFGFIDQGWFSREEPDHKDRVTYMLSWYKERFVPAMEALRMILKNSKLEYGDLDDQEPEVCKKLQEVYEKSTQGINKGAAAELIPTLKAYKTFKAHHEKAAKKAKSGEMPKPDKPKVASSEDRLKNRTAPSVGKERSSSSMEAMVRDANKNPKLPNVSVSIPKTEIDREKLFSGDEDAMEYLKKWIKVNEGLSLGNYVDSEGNNTIGYGHLNTEGYARISKKDADALFEYDFNKHLAEVNTLPEAQHLDPVRKAAVANMVYNMGKSTYMGFRKARENMMKGDYTGVKREILNSLYARQTKGRARDVANVFETGSFQGIRLGNPARVPESKYVDPHTGAPMGGGEKTKVSLPSTPAPRPEIKSPVSGGDAPKVYHRATPEVSPDISRGTSGKGSSGDLSDSKAVTELQRTNRSIDQLNRTLSKSLGSGKSLDDIVRAMERNEKAVRDGNDKELKVEVHSNAKEEKSKPQRVPSGKNTHPVIDLRD